MYNAKYNFEDSIMYRKEGDGYIDTGKRRVSSLTGPSFGLNLITTLGQMNYMDGAITKQVPIRRNIFKCYWHYNFVRITSKSNDLLIKLDWRTTCNSQSTRMASN